MPAARPPANVRPSYTARPGEAVRVAREDDGSFAVGAGRVRIVSDDLQYVDNVVNDIARLAHMVEGVEVLNRGDTIGGAVTIARPDPPTEPPNAWMLPGSGSAGTIVYDPADWPRPGDPHSPSSPEILLTMLREANRNATGSSNPAAGG
jgi:hypothetical protein